MATNRSVVLPVNPECQIIYEGESDVDKITTACDKNPGHHLFFSVSEFKEHLPEILKTPQFLDYIDNMIDRTVKIVVGHTSLARPDTYPNSEMPYPYHDLRGKNRVRRCGTGYILGDNGCVLRTDVPCPCHLCRDSKTPEMKFWTVSVYTSTHVIFDDLEAAKTVCECFYDSKDKKGVKTIYGVTVRNDLNTDGASIVCVTHDEELVMKLRFEYKHVNQAQDSDGLDPDKCVERDGRNSPEVNEEVIEHSQNSGGTNKAGYVGDACDEKDLKDERGQDSAAIAVLTDARDMADDNLSQNDFEINKCKERHKEREGNKNNTMMKKDDNNVNETGEQSDIQYLEEQRRLDIKPKLETVKEDVSVCEADNEWQTRPKERNREDTNIDVNMTTTEEIKRKTNDGPMTGSKATEDEMKCKNNQCEETKTSWQVTDEHITDDSTADQNSNDNEYTLDDIAQDSLLSLSSVVPDNVLLHPSSADAIRIMTRPVGTQMRTMKEDHSVFDASYVEQTHHQKINREDTDKSTDDSSVTEDQIESWESDEDKETEIGLQATSGDQVVEDKNDGQESDDNELVDFTVQDALASFFGLVETMGASNSDYGTETSPHTLDAHVTEDKNEDEDQYSDDNELVDFAVQDSLASFFGLAETMGASNSDYGTETSPHTLDAHVTEDKNEDQDQDSDDNELVDFAVQDALASFFGLAETMGASNSDYGTETSPHATDAQVTEDKNEDQDQDSDDDMNILDSMGPLYANLMLSRFGLPNITKSYPGLPNPFSSDALSLMSRIGEFQNKTLNKEMIDAETALTMYSAIIVSHPHGKSKKVSIGTIRGYTVVQNENIVQGELSHFSMDTICLLPQNPEVDCNSSNNDNAPQAGTSTEQNDNVALPDGVIYVNPGQSTNDEYIARQKTKVPPRLRFWFSLKSGRTVLNPSLMQYIIPSNTEYLHQILWVPGEDDVPNAGLADIKDVYEAAQALEGTCKHRCYDVVKRFPTGTQFFLGNQEVLLPPGTKFYSDVMTENANHKDTNSSYMIYDTSTCPGSSGALVHVKTYGVFHPMFCNTHNGAAHSGNVNMSCRISGFPWDQQKSNRAYLDEPAKIRKVCIIPDGINLPLL